MDGFGLEKCVRADLKEEPCQYEAIFSLNKKPGTAPLTKATNIASDFTKCKSAFLGHFLLGFLDTFQFASLNKVVI